jgi:folate-binding protein YgfZ
MSIADISIGRTRLRLTGADRVEFLHGQCTNEIRGLPVGESCYAAFLNAKGKMRGDAYIVRLEDAFLLEASAGLSAALEKFVITEDVVIEDVSPSLNAWLVIGALPAEAVMFKHPLGTGVISPAARPASLSAAEWEVLRVEAGVPLWGVDMDENAIPVEAGLMSAISYDKGCYIGQETIARIKTYGHVNRHLVQLTSASLPARAAKIFDGEHEVGQVTSAVRSNWLGKIVALGYVRREFASAGVKLAIGQQPAEVLKICGQ